MKKPYNMEDSGEQNGCEEPARPESLLTVEEHARRQGVAPSILAALTQFKQWASGKKTSETVFKDAVNAFLDAPMGRR